MKQELPKKYEPNSVEEKWRNLYDINNAFVSKPSDKPSYSIVIPPPNVTGILHMGHMLNNTIQDVFARRARKSGFEVCWVPGTDHASIATEAKVVKKLADEGISKKDIGREAFLEHAWDWTRNYGGTILKQLKMLGASCDWSKTTFTLDEHYYQSVIKVFVQLFNEGLIYRGARMVNWDPQGKTALSDEEVIYIQKQGQLHYINYHFTEGEGFLTVATTRPETIFADVAIAVNPNDERYKNLLGKAVKIPLLGKEIPIIGEEGIDIEFGTGCLKVTPAHDIFDYEIGLKNNLDIIDLFNEDGTLNEHGHQYKGLDRFETRKRIVKDLQEGGFLLKSEPYTNNVGTSERTGAVIEPRISTQWFLKMDKLASDALEAVSSGEVTLYPDKFFNTYKHWMENCKDWCISRQLWWGHQIPAYYLPNGEIVVAESKTDAYEIAKTKYGFEGRIEDIQQENDTLDTWFSSWLWPMEVFKGVSSPNNEEFNYYYPTKILVTAPEILFFWVARMIMAGKHFSGKKPFDHVYLHGIVRDAKGKKMSKSLGNSPDPLDLIAEYGADGVRTGMLFSAPAGNDVHFDVKLCEQGRNFNNKIWNALRLLKGWETKDEPANEGETWAMNWFFAKLQVAKKEQEQLFEEFRISDALLSIYRLVWDDFCSWYLEMIKPDYEKPISKDVYGVTVSFFDELLHLVHPFMPFVSEEIWHYLKDREDVEFLCHQELPKIELFEEINLTKGELLIELITQLRQYRTENQLSLKDIPEVRLEGDLSLIDSGFLLQTERLSRVKYVETITLDQQFIKKITLKRLSCYVMFQKEINFETEAKRIASELDYLKGFLLSVEKKLQNEKFMASAPQAVIDKELAKKSDLEFQINQLEIEFNNLKQ